MPKRAGSVPLVNRLNRLEKNGCAILGVAQILYMICPEAAQFESITSEPQINNFKTTGVKHKCKYQKQEIKKLNEK